MWHHTKHDAVLVDRTGSPGLSPAHIRSAVQASLSRRTPTLSSPAIASHLVASGRSIFELKMRVLLHYGCYFCSWTEKIAPRMHQNSPFWAQKSEKNFLGGDWQGALPLPRSQWATLSPYLTHPRCLDPRAYSTGLLAHSALDPRPQAPPPLPGWRSTLIFLPPPLVWNVCQ